MPLILKTEAKKLSKNFYYETLCDNCEAFNVYQFLPAQYRAVAKKKRDIEITLSELEGEEKHTKKTKKRKDKVKQLLISREDQLRAIGYTEDQINKMKRQ